MGEDRRMEGQAGKGGGWVVGCQVLGVGSRVLGVQVSWYYDVMSPLLLLLLCLAHCT